MVRLCMIVQASLSVLSFPADWQRTCANISSMSVTKERAEVQRGFIVISATPSRFKTCKALSRNFRNILFCLQTHPSTPLKPLQYSPSSLLWPRHRNMWRQRSIVPNDTALPFPAEHTHRLIYFLFLFIFWYWSLLTFLLDLLSLLISKETTSVWV